MNSARQALPAPEKASTNPTLLALPQGTTSTVTEAAGATEGDKSLLVQSTNVGSSQDCCEPIIEEPMTPPEESDDVSEYDIEDYPLAIEVEDNDRINLYIEEESKTGGGASVQQQQQQEQEDDNNNTTPACHRLPSPSVSSSASTTGSGPNTLQDLGGNMSLPSSESATLTLQQIATDNLKPGHLPGETTIMTVVEMQVDSSETCLQNPPASSSSQVVIPDAPSQELVLLPPEAASIPVPKLKNVGRLRTVHYV